MLWSMVNRTIARRGKKNIILTNSRTGITYKVVRRRNTSNLRLINSPRREYKIKSLHVNRFSSFKDCLEH